MDFDVGDPNRRGRIAGGNSDSQAVLAGAGTPPMAKIIPNQLARDYGLPVVVVAGAGLGTLNHTLLTVEAVRRDGQTVAGLILNHHGVEQDLAAQTNAGILEDLTSLPVLQVHSGTPLNSIPAWLLN
ncbi:MAG: ATP-dependent dethiobiotin synthetase BioD [Puniceicoccaceae bacterium]